MLPIFPVLLVRAAPGAFITFPSGPRSVTSLGDVDGDGCADLALGNVQLESPGSVFVVSGKTGKRLATVNAPEGAKLFGCSVAPLLDYDSDGVRDFAVSAPGAYFRPGHGEPVTGAVFVCSGKSGKVLAKFAGHEPGDAFGVEIANAGDVDGDGTDDLLVGAPGVGRVYVLSGKDGKELRVVRVQDTRLDFGEAVTSLGDIDGDRVPDFAVGAPCENTTGSVHLYSGKDARELRVLYPSSSYGRLWFGSGIAAAGDLDSDGKPDVLVGTDLEEYEFCARVYSSATGKVLLSILQPGNHGFDHFGAAVEMLGDTDGDGVPEYLVADADDVPDVVPAGEANQARGSIVVASGKTGATLFKVFGKKHFDRLGDSMAACGDLDGDHVPDFVAKAAGYFTGEAPCWRAFSGKDGKQLWQFDAPVEKSHETRSEDLKR